MALNKLRLRRLRAFFAMVRGKAGVGGRSTSHNINRRQRIDTMRKVIPDYDPSDYDILTRFRKRKKNL